MCLKNILYALGLCCLKETGEMTDLDEIVLLTRTDDEEQDDE